MLMLQLLRAPASVCQVGTVLREGGVETSHGDGQFAHKTLVVTRA